MPSYSSMFLVEDTSEQVAQFLAPALLSNQPSPSWAFRASGSPSVKWVERWVPELRWLPRPSTWTGKDWPELVTSLAFILASKPRGEGSVCATGAFRVYHLLAIEPWALFTILKGLTVYVRENKGPC